MLFKLSFAKNENVMKKENVMNSAKVHFTTHVYLHNYDDLSLDMQYYIRQIICICRYNECFYVELTDWCGGTTAGVM